MTQSLKKTPENAVVVVAKSGYLRLQLPRALYDGKQKVINLGLKDTPENRKIAEAKRIEISADVKAQLLGGDAFDWTWERYTGIKRPKLTVIQALAGDEPPAKPKLKLGELWEMWLEHKRPQVKETTFYIYQTTYCNLLNPISHLEINARCVQEIYQHLITTSSDKKTITNILSQLSQAYERALNLELAEGKNHFYGMAEEAKTLEKPTGKTTKSVDEAEEDRRAFTRSEVTAILDFLIETGNHWHNLTKFLFMTGCRPGEAAALRWGHIKSDLSAIYFQERYYQTTKSTNTLKNSRNGEGRWFPCYRSLQEFLASIKPSDAKPDDLVFKGIRGNQVDWAHYGKMWRGHMSDKDKNGNKHWIPGFIEILVQQGKLRHYLKPYSTRHTFISLMVDAGHEAMQVARWCGNSPDIIWKHYYQHKHDIRPTNLTF